MIVHKNDEPFSNYTEKKKGVRKSAKNIFLQKQKRSLSSLANKFFGSLKNFD